MRLIEEEQESLPEENKLSWEPFLFLTSGPLSKLDAKVTSKSCVTVTSVVFSSHVCSSAVKISVPTVVLTTAIK